MAIASFTLYFTFALIEPGLAFYIYDALHLRPTQFGLIVANFSLTLARGEPVGGKFCEKQGPRRAIVLGLLLNTISGLQLVFAKTFLDLIVMASLAGIENALANPAIGVEVTKTVLVQQRSTWLGIYSSLVNIAGFSGPLLGGILYSQVGPSPTFLIAFFISAIVTVLFLVLYNPSRSLQVPDLTKYLMA